ncbi:hypothetical protein HBI49_055740 [Parastagonospora nodorum]|nr:hypothetical protein HBI49_055740 [Parastagonospora nodorum]KAH6001708.1 hypothetical protein HBI83_211720 [Parastagonospora nodorum]KAH6349073.1 hypothetical protein HBI37_056480 [Parastagonospora nodorum]KAH6375018.1 hypothetical protein HBI36_005300 [Parastagonospora nodorum]
MALHHLPLLKALGENAHKIRRLPVSVELLDKTTQAPFDAKLDYAERFESQLLELVRKKLSLEHVQSLPSREALALECGLDSLFGHLTNIFNRRLQVDRSQSRSGVSDTVMRLIDVLDDAQYPVDLCGEGGSCLFKFDTIQDARIAHSFARNVNHILQKVHMTTSTHRNLSRPVKNPQAEDIVDTWIQTFGRASSERLGQVLDTIKAEFDACELAQGDTTHELQLLVSSYENQHWEAQGGPNMCLLCPGANAWQLGLSGNDMHITLCHEMCESIDFDQGLALMLYEDSNSFEPGSTVVDFTHRPLPTSLKGLIENESLFSLPIVPYRFGRKQRRSLAAKLALHLSIFCPWWRHASAPWDENAVHFLKLDSGKIDRESPFIVWKLGTEECHGEEIDARVLAGSFASFAKLLLEIEYGSISNMGIPEYELDNGNLAKSLRKIHKDLLQDADPITQGPYMEAVRACLDFHQRYKFERSRQDVSLRSVVFENPQDTYQRLVRSEITSRVLKGLPDFDILSKRPENPGDDVAEHGDYPYENDCEIIDDDVVPEYRDVPGDLVAVEVSTIPDHSVQPVLKRKISQRWDNLQNGSPSDELEESLRLSLSLTERDVRSMSSKLIIPRVIEPSLHDSIESVIRGLSDAENGHLFDHEPAPDSQQAQERRTDKWFNNFIKLLKALRLGETSAEPLKVAILDSGFNLKNPEFNTDERNRVKCFKSFVDDEPNVDKVDHGTFIATIILRLSVNVDLYIAKITNTNNPDVKTVVEALKYARTTWKVNMISLSFGFDRTNPSDGLFEEIKACLHKDIIVFASASNDGPEGSRTYPAKFPDVICVHSADQRGRKSEFNPTPRGDGDLSFIGEHVRPTWGRTDLTNTSQMVYRDGTSYATPVAVAFAAFMIGFIHTKGWAEWQWTYAPSSPIGMKQILKMMSERTEVYRWVSPTRFFKYTRMDTMETMLKEPLVYGNMESRI